ncbi:MAG: hypothetical protein AAFV53_32275 [Myxococcota bacterium]
MSDRGKQLAARLKAGIDRQLVEDRRREAARRARIAAAQAARAAFLDDLRSFGREVGHFEVKDDKDGGLILNFGKHHLVFRPEGEQTAVRISGDQLNADASAYLEETLEKWVLRWTNAAKRTEQILFFDQGLEVLIRTGFDVQPLDEVEVFEDALVDVKEPRRTL